MPAFDWKDPLQLNAQLGEEERQIREQVRAYAEKSLLPRIVKANRDESFDPAIMEEMGEVPRAPVSWPVDVYSGVCPGGAFESVPAAMLTACVDGAAGRDD